MGPGLKDRRGLESLTADELKQLWVEACKSWTANSDVEPAGIEELEAELDFRNEGLAFHLIRNELAILASSQKAIVKRDVEH
jgi:hypothetical protein